MCIRDRTDTARLSIASGGDATFSGAISGTTGTFSSHVSLGDSDELRLGAGSDLKLYHTGTSSYIDNATNDLFIRNTGDDITIQAADDITIAVQGGENAIVAFGDGSVDLYHNNEKRIETTSNGALVQTNGDAYLTLLADADNNAGNSWPLIDFRVDNLSGTTEARIAYRQDNSCLLYTSDAADDLL